MNAAIYSAGPSIKSLAQSPRLPAHERAHPLRIGVNSAICYLPNRWLHWYAAGDAFCYTPNYTGHRPASGWCCSDEAARASILAGAPDFGALPSLTWADLADLVHIPQTYSITAAIALAAHLGARAVTIYAHDRAIGKRSACDRSPSPYDVPRLAVESDHITTLSRILRGRMSIYIAPPEKP